MLLVGLDTAPAVGAGVRRQSSPTRPTGQGNNMKKLFGFLLKTIAILLSLLIVAIFFFRVVAALRETQTRHEAAPATGRFVKAGDVELYIQEIKPEGERGTIIFIHGTAAWSGLWQETMKR